VDDLKELGLASVGQPPHVRDDDYRPEDRGLKLMWEFNRRTATQPRATPKRGRQM
jgi:hypothetical protein